MATPRTIYLLSRLHYALRQRIENNLSEVRLTAVQYTVMSMLQGRDLLSSAEIARRYCVKPQSMNETIFALERRGLIARTESPENRRILLVSLTREGRDLLNRCDALIDDIEREIFAGFDADAVERFRTDVRTLLALAMNGEPR